MIIDEVVVSDNVAAGVHFTSKRLRAKEDEWGIAESKDLKHVY